MYIVAGFFVLICVFISIMLVVAWRLLVIIRSGGSCGSPLAIAHLLIVCMLGTRLPLMLYLCFNDLDDTILVQRLGITVGEVFSFTLEGFVALKWVQLVKASQLQLTPQMRWRTMCAFYFTNLVLTSTVVVLYLTNFIVAAGLVEAAVNAILGVLFVVYGFRLYRILQEFYGDSQAEVPSVPVRVTASIVAVILFSRAVQFVLFASIDVNENWPSYLYLGQDAAVCVAVLHLYSGGVRRLVKKAARRARGSAVSNDYEAGFVGTENAVSPVANSVVNLRDPLLAVNSG